MKPVIIHSQARTELDEAIAYYERQKAGLGLDLQAAVEQTISKVQENPQVGAPYKAMEFRYYVIQKFPCVVFYAELAETIWVVAITHGRRRPGYWTRRRVE